jgi:hypothetical protein
LVRIVKLDDFYFLYPPTVKPHWRRVGINDITVTGRAVDAVNLGQLHKVCHRTGPMPFESALVKSEVAVKYFRSKGLNYRIRLLEYTPLVLRRRDAQTDTMEDIGRLVDRPRFEVRFIPKSKATPPTINSDSWGLQDLSIHVEVSQRAQCHFVFEGWASQAKLGVGASLGDRVEVRLGYVGALETVYSGVLTRLEEIYTRTLDFTAESFTPDATQQSPQRYTYFLVYGENMIQLRFEEDSNGFVQFITAPGLPHLRPADRISIFHRDRRAQSHFPLVSEVVHDFDRAEAFRTRITIK